MVPTAQIYKRVYKTLWTKNPITNTGINNNSHKPVAHFHLYDKNLNRYYKDTVKNYPEIKEKYSKYLKEFNLYDKC